MVEDDEQIGDRQQRPPQARVGSDGVALGVVLDVARDESADEKARLRAVARRGPVEHLPKLRVAGLTLGPATHRASRAGKRISLTKTEYLLLEMLMRQSGRVVSRAAIIQAVWGFESSIESNTLDAFVRLLRNKVDSGHDRKLIHTVRGVGYVLQEDEPS